MTDLRRAILSPIYASSAVLAFVGTFLPLWAPLEPGDAFTTMNLWGATTIGGGGFAILGVVLQMGLVGTLVASAALPYRPRALRVAVIAICLVATTLLILKPASSTPKPDLGAGGSMLLALSIFLVVTAAVDLIADPPASE